MQTTIKFPDGATYNTSAAVLGKKSLAGFNRETLTITAVMTYAEAAAHFTDGAVFTLTDEFGDSFEWNEHGVAGPITDNRDGTVTAIMGKNNTAEQDYQQQAQKAAESTVTLAGKPVSSDTEVSELRAAFEQAAAKLSDTDALIAPSLSAIWNPYRYVAQGERRYYAPSDALYKCLVSHETSLETAPDVSKEYWSKL